MIGHPNKQTKRQSNRDYYFNTWTASRRGASLLASVVLECTFTLINGKIKIFFLISNKFKQREAPPWECTRTNLALVSIKMNRTYFVPTLSNIFSSISYLQDIIKGVSRSILMWTQSQFKKLIIDEHLQIMKKTPKLLNCVISPSIRYTNWRRFYCRPMFIRLLTLNGYIIRN